MYNDKSVLTNKIKNIKKLKIKTPPKNKNPNSG